MNSAALEYSIREPAQLSEPSRHAGDFKPKVGHEKSNKAIFAIDENHFGIKTP